ncbi:hypothetical protein [Vampirovibrio sp.]|uniref:hypothetical protein n=1 Tax=Vampirovibrio sp. TaxID=2717857 RepID=UPI003593730A
MRTPLDNSIQIVNSPHNKGAAALLLLCVLLLSACEAPSGAPGGRPGRSAPAGPGAAALSKMPGSVRGGMTSKPPGLQTVSKEAGDAAKLNPFNVPAPEKPSEVKNQPDLNPLGPMAKVEQAGNTVELASVIIAVKANPFLDWLPKPLVPVEMVESSNSTPVAASAPLDPFSAVTLLGVIYNAKLKMGLVSVDGNQTQFVQQGSVLNLSTGPAEVLAVRANGLDLRLRDDRAQKRTFTLPDIVGYSANGAKAESDSGSAVEAATRSAGSGGGNPAPSSDGLNLPALGQLKKIMDSSPIAQKGSPSGVPVNLQEL